MKEQGYVTKRVVRNFYVLHSVDIKVPIVDAILFSSVHLKEIRNVAEWATQMGCSRSYFSRRVKLYYNESPKNLLRNAKFLAVFLAFLKKPDAKAIVIARETGFDNEKSLDNFEMAFKNPWFFKAFFQLNNKQQYS